MVSKRKYKPPKVGDIFGNWTVIDPEEKHMYPDSTNSSRYTKGVLVECPHGVQIRVPIWNLHNTHRHAGCKQCGNEAKFKGCGDLSGSYLNSIIQRAEKKKLKYNVAPEYLWNLFLEQDRKCALSGVDITLDRHFGTNSRDNTTKFTQTASLDRIDSAKGYIEGNVQWIHKQVNLMKLDMGQDEFVDFCDLISKNKKAEPKFRVVARVNVEGIHRWADCPLEEVDYLKNYHRHTFYIIAKAYVTHEDRDIEFIQLAHNIRRHLTDKYYNEQYRCLFFDNMSCEMIADELVNIFNLYECEVNEDGEGGAIVRNI